MVRSVVTMLCILLVLVLGFSLTQASAVSSVPSERADSDGPVLSEIKMEPRGGWVGIGGVIKLIAVTGEAGVKPGACTMNNADIEGKIQGSNIEFTYIVQEGDFPFQNGKMTMNCAVKNKSGTRKITMADVHEFSVSVDSERVKSGRISVSPSSGTVVPGDSVEISFAMSKTDLAVPTCLVNKKANIVVTQDTSGRDSEDASIIYKGIYLYKDTHPSWAPGKLPLKCVFVDKASNRLGVEAWNDLNALEGFNAKIPEVEDSEPGQGGGGAGDDSASVSMLGSLSLVTIAVCLALLV